MEIVRGFKWKKDKTVKEFVEDLSHVGFQSIELFKACELILKMKREKAKIIFSFTSNLGTSGLSEFIAQLTKMRFFDIIITTAGAIEEDIMKAMGEKFLITSFNADDVELFEKGYNRVGNLLISNDSYQRLEGFLRKVLLDIYKEKNRLSVSELLYKIGKKIEEKDLPNKENSFLYWAYKNNIPIFCPAITDGSIGFQLFLVQQDYKDFIVDIVKDFGEAIFSLSQDDKKGLISLGGGVSKHFGLLISLINGGLDYAVYITTARPQSGSMSGATTSEAKSWGKIKDDSDAVTVYGDATILFPLIMHYVLDVLEEN
ncbi:MAG TPA: deoxyhypusine synthase [Nautiliaceae bacterium]|nr:deoxyhypusine synthase [Nautiliaceae bacterium]